MRKKRVLALLLAFSMAVSTNGMTVFATETGTEPVSAVMEAEPEETESADEIDYTGIRRRCRGERSRGSGEIRGRCNGDGRF